MIAAAQLFADPVKGDAHHFFPAVSAADVGRIKDPAMLIDDVFLMFPTGFFVKLLPPDMPPHGRRGNRFDVLNDFDRKRGNFAFLRFPVELVADLFKRAAHLLAVSAGASDPFRVDDPAMTVQTVLLKLPAPARVERNVIVKEIFSGCRKVDLRTFPGDDDPLVFERKIFDQTVVETLKKFELR